MIKIKVHNVFIDQDYMVKYGLRSKLYEKRTYWRVVGYLVISQSGDDTKSKKILFQVNLPAGEKTFGGDELIFKDDGTVVEFDKSILKIDLKEKIDNFIKAFKNHAVYNVYKKGSRNYQGKMIGYYNRMELKYDGWIELKIIDDCYQVLLFDLPNWAVK